MIDLCFICYDTILVTVYLYDFFDLLLHVSVLALEILCRYMGGIF